MPKLTKLHIFVIVVILAAVGFYAWRTYSLNKHGDGAWPDLDGGVYSQPVKSNGLSYLIPPDEMYDSGLGKDGHPRLIDPEMVDIATADDKIADDLRGIAVSVDGDHRFYPYQIMNWHGVVHDTVGGQELAITYDALTGAAVVYEASVDGQALQFGDSGKVYNNAMLMYADGSETLWNQATGQAVVGEAVGDKLATYPSVVMRWDEWKEEHPDGLCLSTNTGFARDYGRHPYGAYEKTKQVFFPLNHVDDRLSAKEDVYRLELGAEQLVFSTAILGAQTEPNETLGEGEDAIHAVAFMDYDTFTTRVFSRELDGQVLTFVREGKATITDKETGTTWSLDGRALRGELAGQQLELLPSVHLYAFAQLAMYPETQISGYNILHPETEAVEPTEGESIEIDVTE
jgi:hypothetical protein